MSTRHIPATVVALSAVAILLIASAAVPSHAAAQPTRAGRLAVMTETGKVTLAETSIASPAVIGSPFHGFVIAWTGTDAAHHLNLRSGTTNLSFPNKTTLRETSPFAPALYFRYPLEGSPQPFALAWTGTNAYHSLNVQLFPGGAAAPGGPKLTLQETSIAGPALSSITFNNDTTSTLLLAWTGTDTNHSLNVLPLTVRNGNALIPGTKTVLRQFSSNAGPGLIFASLGWSNRATRQLEFAASFDAVHFSSASSLPETSAFAPQAAGVGQDTNSVCTAWTGTDAAHHLNVQCTSDFFPPPPRFPNPGQTKTVLSETALGAPGLDTVSVQVDGATLDIAWTGTDAAHHLNVAVLRGP